MKGAMKMAWITEQALADYLNWYPNRNENEELLRSLLAEDVTFTMGTRCYRGIDAVMNEFSNMSDAIHIDQFWCEYFDPGHTMPEDEEHDPNEGPDEMFRFIKVMK